ncbi:HlyD family secretion protein [Capnocytophaga catalasegens]|uniref:Membrane protein n=1 Tax=Capnocytophaga catalasegens TaxID=1004260 RepID=A0AAV5AQI9_9FLAO|nr:biotin/lipoyl-binding protein [Capnocytophaga catalasegens]GIZ15647.1 membrane protein [Capnocytophaga catalasegens]GJM49542.1 membrane protein [Capnocytophaga catalasegens]GJM51749.1 membrane protein [Capnocytophaga catalasegens]
MLELIIAIYAGICWLLIKKLKLIPWTFTTQVIVYSRIFGSIAMILSLNYYTPITSDVRVGNRSVDIASQITGKVKKVYVETNQEVKKGDTLFVLDKTPFVQEIKSLEAKIESTLATVNSYDKDIAASRSQISSIQTQLDLANKRVTQFQELVAAGAANRFDLDQAITTAHNLQAQLATAQSQMQSLQIKSSVVHNGENASVSELRAKLEQARWNLDQTVVLAPTDGIIPNVQLNEGALLLPMKSAFVLIQKQQSVIGYFAQNELQAVKPGDEVEIALRTKPGKVVKAKLEYVIEATNQGIMNNATSALSGSTSGIPNTAQPLPEIESRLIAKFVLSENHPPLTTGARGTAVIYSDNIKPLHLVRKVMVRMTSNMNYFIPKLH